MKTAHRRILSLSVPAFILFSAGALLAQPAGPAADPSGKLAAIADLLRSRIAQNDRDLAAAAKAIAASGLAGAQARAALSDLCAKHQTFVDCVTIDPNGTIVIVSSSTYQRLQGQPAIGQDVLQRTLATRAPAVGNLFQAPEGFFAISINWPVIAKGQTPLGVVRAIARPTLFLQEMIEPKLPPGFEDVWVMQTDGRIIYSRNKDAIGDDFLPRYTSGGKSTLPDLVQTIASTPSGTGTYRQEPVGKADPVQVGCAWQTVDVHGTPWRVAIFYR